MNHYGYVDDYIEYHHHGTLRMIQTPVITGCCTDSLVQPLFQMFTLHIQCTYLVVRDPCILQWSSKYGTPTDLFQRGYHGGSGWEELSPFRPVHWMAWQFDRCHSGWWIARIWQWGGATTAVFDSEPSDWGVYYSCNMGGLMGPIEVCTIAVTWVD